MESADFIVIGGGIGGCTVASQLHEKFPTLSILVIEAGTDISKDPDFRSPSNQLVLSRTPLDWNYTTVPQTHLDGKTCTAAAGKALGGGSVINAS
jgi:choline dehydrogenase-like flavoprotein